MLIVQIVLYKLYHNMKHACAEKAQVHIGCTYYNPLHPSTEAQTSL
jgi:hypothetical protein